MDGDYLYGALTIISPTLISEKPLSFQKNPRRRGGTQGFFWKSSFFLYIYIYTYICIYVYTCIYIYIYIFISASFVKHVVGDIIVKSPDGLLAC